MAIHKPSELKAFLESIGARPNKRLSQNFLIDGVILDKIIALAAVTADDLVFEIGPGPGALTERLLATGCEVIAIEKDPLFAKALGRFQSDKLKVVCADALEYEFKTKRMAKVVANLPYHLTTPLIEKLVLLPEYISACVLMVQKEVAEKFLATTHFDYVSLFLHYHARLQYGCTVPASCFYPAPKVTSSVIRLDLEKSYKVPDEKAFFAWVKQAFSQKRKMIKKTLGKEVGEALCALGKNPESRPEELSLADWIDLTRVAYDS